MTIPMPEPVAVIGSDYAIFWAGSGPIAPICERTGATVGSQLITTTQAEAYAAARVAESQRWQPIEMAPKDGSRVILAWGGKSMSGFFLDNSRSPNPWAGWRTESMVPTPAGQPLHWMSLPAPPQQ